MSETPARIAVAGIGYVGLSNAVLLAQHNTVMALDIDPVRVEMVNNRQSPLVDPELEDYLANKALDLFPEEANFHALRGDLRLVDKQYGMAITNFDRAISRRSNFFYYHLQRGIAKKELGQTDGAVVDLERSLTLLQTAPAHFALGKINQDRGAVDEAIKHYKAVAQSSGPYGDAAKTELAKLELPTNPSAYIASACGDDGSGIAPLRALC